MAKDEKSPQIVCKGLQYGIWSETQHFPETQAVSSPRSEIHQVPGQCKRQRHRYNFKMYEYVARFKNITIRRLVGKTFRN